MQYTIFIDNIEISPINDEYFLNKIKKNSIITIKLMVSCIIKFLIIKNKKIKNYELKYLNYGKKIDDNVYLFNEDMISSDTIILIPNTKNLNNIELKITNINIIPKINEQITLLTNSNTYKFIVVTNKRGLKIAENLNNMLKVMNFLSEIFIGDEIPDEMLINNERNDNEFFIILFSQLHKKMPNRNKYIIYQLEQKQQNNIVNQNVLNNILNSLITWDYSNENMRNFSDIYRSKIYFQPISISTETYNTVKNNDSMYDILFYGFINKRRNNIINHLTTIYGNKIYRTCNLYGTELYDVIKKSKIILNIHAYENSILETSRINEVLPFNKVIISEYPYKNDDINKNFYENKISFCDEIKQDLSNIDVLINKINYFLNKKNYNDFLTSTKLKIKTIYDNSFSKFKNNMKIVCSLISNLDLYDKHYHNNFLLYESSSQLKDYIKIFNKNYSDEKILCIDEKRKTIPNYYDIDTFFYANVNKLFNESDNFLLQHIYANGICNGFLYHPKQLYNIFPNCKITINKLDKHLYIFIDNKFYLLNDFIANNIYNKNANWYFNQLIIKDINMFDDELTLFVFVGNEQVGINLINKIIEYKNLQNFNLAICFRNNDLYDILSSIIKLNFNNYSIFVSKEYGNDIIPTLMMYEFLCKKINIQKIIKLHTKSSDKLWFENLTTFLLTKNLNELLTFKQNDSNCIGPERYLRSDDFNKNIINKYINKINKYKFVRGSMFLCDNAVFDSLIKIIKLDYKMYFNNNLYENNNINVNNSPVHALERLFGTIKIIN